jgi:hypothetical protein
MPGHERPVFKIPTRNPQPALLADGGGSRGRAAAAQHGPGTLRAAGLHGSNADLGTLARILATELTTT